MSEIFAFDDFELDGARFELRRAGKPLEAQPKVLRLLLYLAANRDRAVAGEELLRVLWPDTTVGAGSVRRAVLGARHLLGDGPDSNSSIRTVRGLGYQFVRRLTSHSGAAVAHGPLSALEPSPSVQSAPDSRSAFFGCEPVLARLEASLDEALHTSGRCVLLTGGPGIGKTRTAQELWARARARGAQTWLGHCTSVDGVPAFWPFIQVLRDALRDRGAAEVRALMGQGISDIAQAIPELAQVLPDLPEAPPLTTQSERFRFYDSITVFLRRAAERAPIVLGFDDLHQADPATLQLLTFAVRQLGQAPILIVGTFRRELVGAFEPPPLLHALVREERTRCIELSGFDRSTIRSYLAAATGAQPPELTIDALQEQTGGNPLFVRQLVEGWLATDAATNWQKLASFSHRLDLQSAIQRHLEVVTEPCRALLRVASVLGREFSSALLARLVEESIEPVWQRLSQAEATHLIEASADPNRFRFTHSLIRGALYRQLPRGERARLHGQAARALEAQGIGQNYVSLAEVTRHFVEAAPAHDSGRALDYSLRAAEMAMARLAYEEAAAHCQCALQLLDYGAPDPLRRMTLLFRKGAALTRASELAAGRAALFEALDLARERGDAELMFQAASLIASRPESGAVDSVQLAALRDAMAALPEHDQRRALLQASLAKSLTYSSDRSELVQLARAALQDGRTLADVPLRAEVLARCHEALLGPEYLAERVSIAAELSQLAHRQGDVAALLRASQVQIETCIERADMEAVERVLTNMETLAERVREPFFRWNAKAVRGTQALVYGQPGVAERCAHDAYAIGAPVGEELARHAYCTQLIAIFMLQDRVAELEPLAREMALRYPALRGWSARQGVVDAALGRRESAQRCLAEIMEQGLERTHSEPFALATLCSIVELCRELRDRQAARPLYQALLPYADHFGFTHLGVATFGPVRHYLGILAALQDDFVVAEGQFTRALESARAVRSPTYIALSAGLFGQLLLKGGSPERRTRASALLEEALSHAERCDLTAIIQFVDRLARRHNLKLTPHA